jgi:hypothetical protein
MNTEDIKKMALALQAVQEASKKKLDPVGKEDGDIDNDGDKDKSDEYLHARRKAVSAAIKGKSMKEEEDRSKLDTFIKNMDGNKLYPATKRRPPTQHVMKAKKDVQKEEVEELDELSKETLGSYVKKASRNLAGREYKRGAEKDTSTTNLQKSYKRDMGISKAVDKMTKEEVDEAKLTDKQVKAALSAAKAQPKDKVSLKPAPWDKKDMKESRWPIYNRIQEAKDAHLKSATAPEAIDSKASKGEKDFVNLHGGLNGNDSGIDGAKAALQTAQAALSRVKPAAKRPGDNPAGDKSIIKSTEAK